jgi:hypothetical protein
MGTKAKLSFGRGVQLIRDERLRQIEVERYDATHDDGHAWRALTMGAMAYLAVNQRGGTDDAAMIWPFPIENFKPGPPLRNLVKAGAMIAAEIDRLLRLQVNADRVRKAGAKGK